MPSDKAIQSGEESSPQGDAKPARSGQKKPAGAGESAKPPAIDAPQRRRLPPLLRRAWYSLNQAFRRRIAHLGVTPDQFTILRWLQEVEASEGITQRALSDLMASDPNTITSLLTRMEAAKLIERRPHETDRRAKLARILPQGRAVYQQARKIAVDLQQEVVESLPERRRDRFLEELETLADACREAADETGA